MKSLFNKYVWLQLILSILLLFGGTLIIVFAANNKSNILADSLNIIAAVILFLFGVFTIVAAFVFESKKAFTSSFLYGSACIALGIFLLLKEMVLLDYLVILLSIFFIVMGAIELIKAIMLNIYNRKRVTEIVIAYIISVIFIVGGILSIIYREDVRLIFCYIVGAILIAVGICEMVFGIKRMINQNKKKSSNSSRSSTKNEKKIAQEDKVVAEVAKEEIKEEIKEIDYTDKPAIEQKQ